MIAPQQVQETLSNSHLSVGGMGIGWQIVIACHLIENGIVQNQRQWYRDYTRCSM